MKNGKDKPIIYTILVWLMLLLLSPLLLLSGIIAIGRKIKGLVKGETE